MLQTLYIENIAVIEKTSIDFSNGLSYYTEPNMANFTAEMKDALIECSCTVRKQATENKR